MIKLLTQETQFYCSTEEEAEETILTRKKESMGKVIKYTTENKEGFTKLTIKEEYNTAIDLAKLEPTDDNKYYEMFDSDGHLIEYHEPEEKLGD